jgi:hypothetical protein
MVEQRTMPADSSQSPRRVICLAGLKEDDSVLRTRRDLLAQTARVHRHPDIFRFSEL